MFISSLKSNATISQLVDSLNKFSLKTLQLTNPQHETENAIFSPYSAFACVTMSTSLFKSQTRAEILESLCITSDGSQIEQVLKQLRTLINKENTDKVSSCNRIWANKDINFNPKTFEPNKKILGIPIEKETFPEPACDKINREVSKATKGMIPRLVDPSDLGADTAIVLLNAIYFKSNWEKKFDIAPSSRNPNTKNFTLVDGTQIHTDIIQSYNRDLQYAENDKFQVVSIPYVRNQYDFVIILPKNSLADDYQDLLTLTYETLNNELLTKFQLKKVNIKMPKFSFESKIELNEIFQSLGMSQAFTELAECTDPSVRYYVSKIIQKAKIVLDENGTVAAAATGMTMNCLSLVDEDPSINVFADHPFAFLLRNKQTGSILFEGFVKNPLM